ncbi:MAG: hypothetical protein PVG39_04390 [Desulfobacteraceae bacterium]|jgi:hypothetical protein
MAQNINSALSLPGNTSNPVPIKDQYSSVEFCIDELGYTYQFKVWETETPGINILVNQNSVILKHLHVGNTFDIKCYPSDCSGYPVKMRTEIKHIKKDCGNRVRGHILVGLAVNELGKNN